jgi:hypothetical protein
LSVAVPLEFLGIFLMSAATPVSTGSASPGGDERYLPADAFYGAVGVYRAVRTLDKELEQTEAAMRTLKLKVLRGKAVADQIRCTLIPTPEGTSRSVTMSNVTTSAVVVGTSTANGGPNSTAARGVPSKLLSVLLKDFEDGQCPRTPSDRTGVPPVPPGEVVAMSGEHLFLLVETVRSGRYSFCRLWAQADFFTTATPELDRPLRKACTAMFEAVGLEGVRPAKVIY